MRTQLLRNIPLFETLSDADLQHLEAGSLVQYYPKHSCLTFEGESGDSMYILYSGQVSVTTATDDGQPLNIAILNAGEYFGEQAILPESNGLRTATTRCLTDVEVLKIPKDVFFVVLKRYKNILTTLKDIGAKQLRHRIAQKTALFRAIPLTPDAKDWLTEKHFNVGDVVFHQGDEPDAFYLVLSGVATVSKAAHGHEKVLNYIGCGGFFGESALISHTPRTETVRAKTSLSTLVLRGESFQSLYRKSKDLQQHLDNLSSIYQLPQRGLITMHSSKLMRHNTTTAIFHNAAGAQVALSRVVGESICSMAKTNRKGVLSTHHYRFNDTLTGARRELVISDGYILSAVCVGEWLDIGYLLNMIYKGRRLTYRQLALFRLEGNLRLEREEFQANDEAILCQCAMVSRGSLKKCINSGFNTVQDVGDESGAGKICGSCIPLIADMVGRSNRLLVRFIDAKQVGENTKSFRFKPQAGVLKPFIATQHVLIEAKINAQWVKRSYTLTSPSNSTQYYEITVKKEENGLFSSWLHDTMTPADLIRVCTPVGGYKFEENIRIPYVFFSAGVGITPALSYLRSMNKTESKRDVFVDISTKSPTQAICFDEFNRLAKSRKNLTVNTRFTKTRGHIQPADIENIVTAYPLAGYFICGPKSYQKAIQKSLRNLGVSEKNIQVEFFAALFDRKQPTNISKIKHQYEGRRPALVLSLFAIAGVILLSSLPVIDLLTSVNLDYQSLASLQKILLTDKMLKQVTGYFILGFIVLGMLISLRKRAKVVNFVRFTWWRLGHIFFGVLALVGVYFHSGLSLGHNLNF